MNFNGNTFQTGFAEENLSQELIISRFKNLGKEKFQDYVVYNMDPQEFIKDCSTNYKLNLPEEFSEFLVTDNLLPYYFLADLPVLKKVEEIFRRLGYQKLDGAGNLDEIKKFYSKWVFQKNEKEKQFFALSTINIIERNTNKNNFLKYIYKAVVLGYDARISSSEKALESLDTALNVIELSELDEKLKTEVKYLIYLLSGMILIRVGQYAEAGIQLTAAMALNRNGVSVLLYAALAEKEQGNIEDAVKYLSKLVDLDKRRLSLALTTNNINFFNYLLKTCFAYSIFQELRFAHLNTNIEFIIDSLSRGENNSFQKLSIWMGRLEELRLKEYYNEQINTQLNFLEEFSGKYRNNINAFILDIGSVLEDKFIKITEMILSVIRALRYEQLSKNLQVYDIQIKEAGDAVKYLRQANNEKRELIKRQIEESIKIVESDYDLKIEYTENQLNNLDKVEKFDPGNAFSSAMFFNMVISMLIFVIGGFGSGMMAENSAGLSLPDFFMNGLKWGGITFLLGFFVSLFTAASTISEKSSEKSRIEKRIDTLRNQKQIMIKQFQKDGDERLKIFEKSYNDEIGREDLRLDKLKIEKNTRLENLNTQVEEAIHSFKEKMKFVLS